MENLTKSDLLKLIQFNESLLDIDKSKKTFFECEQLKSAVTILIHLKYILLYVKEQCFVDIEFKLDRIAPLLKDDLDFCQTKYNQLIDSAKFLDFVRNKENNYPTDSSSSDYYPFKREQFSDGEEDLATKFLNYNLSNDFVSNFSNENRNNNNNNNDETENSFVIRSGLFNNQELSENDQTKFELNEIQNMDDSNKVMDPANVCETVMYVTPTKTTEKQKKSSSEQSTLSKATTSRHRNYPKIDDSNMETDLVQMEYWCSYEGCRFKCKSLTQVKAHEERRHIKQILKCSQDGCDEVFNTKEEFDSHIVELHSTTALFDCEIEDCEAKFASDFSRKKHFRQEHSDEYLTCKMCEKKFKTRKNLTSHLRRMHPMGDIDMMTTIAEDFGGSTIKCTINGCNKKFAKKSKLRIHMKEKHRDIYLTCKFCDKACKSRNNLTNHIWMMHEEGDFKCPEEDCQFSAKIRKILLNHRKLRHQRTRKCTIEGCGQVVPITRYHRHLSSLHKIKNYCCSWPDCGKSFADNSALKNHVRIHLNFKRFKCKWPECGYASEQRHTVITHIRVCHFKLPRTKKKQLEMNITQDSVTQNPYDYLEACREDICI